MNIELLYKYFKKNILVFSIILYETFAIFFKIIFQIDILIPCFWKLTFGFKCPSCGLTTSLIHLLNFEFYNAIQSNFLIIVVLPAFIYYIIKDIFDFYKLETSNHSNGAYPKSQMSRKNKGN
jgi:hypothetical protein